MMSRSMKKTLMWMVTGVLVALMGVVLMPGAPTALAQGGEPLRGFPDDDPNSGRFINVTIGLSSLGDVASTQNVFNLSLEVPASEPNLILNIFDGDMGGTWDRYPTDGAGNPAFTLHNIIFELYPDPLLQGNSSVGMITSWDSDAMPDDGWYPINMANDASALNAAGTSYFYHLVARWETTNGDDEQNNFKVVVNGQPFLLAGSTIGLEGYGVKLIPGIPPLDLPLTTYDGTFSLAFLVPGGAGAGVTDITLYDGDLDLFDDTEDANSPSDLPRNCGDVNDEVCPGDNYDPLITFPPFQTAPVTVFEGVNPGDPADDNQSPEPRPRIRRSPNIYYEVYDSNNNLIGTNTNVSGDKEWEVFNIATPAATGLTYGPPDATADSLPSGLYRWEFIGVDGLNTMFLHSDYTMYPIPRCDEPCEAPGTGTPGYWKNHPQAWPLTVITVGGETYSRDEAIALMEAATKKDKTYNMFEQLVAAVLNGLVGNDTSCIDATISAAQDWMTDNPVGSGVKADSSTWQDAGSALHTALDDYNNGRLECADHRD